MANSEARERRRQREIRLRNRAVMVVASMEMIDEPADKLQTLAYARELIEGFLSVPGTAEAGNVIQLAGARPKTSKLG